MDSPAADNPEPDAPGPDVAHWESTSELPTLGGAPDTPEGRVIAAFCDTVVPGAEQLSGWVSFDNPVSANAMDILRQRFGEVARGEVLLNAVEDEKAFDRDMGIKPYAFDNSPLVRLFMRQDGSGGAS